jgi:hypothetical protein
MDPTFAVCPNEDVVAKARGEPRIGGDVPAEGLDGVGPGRFVAIVLVLNQQTMHVHLLLRR